MERIIEKIKDYKIILILISGVLVGYIAVHSLIPARSSNPSTAQVIKPQASEKKSNEHKEVSSPKKGGFVDIQGAVKNPGVYAVQPNSIVRDAIAKAGGITANAEVKQINQAQKVTDSMQIYVPFQGEKPSVASSSLSSSMSGKEKQKVNINTASPDDFKDVSGIGPKKAEKIIDFREKNGNFEKLEDLTKVSGIGAKTIDSLRDSLTV
ncbi:helix-hairpin-helix domain-containing protein [Companilactobacillus ginsenosidimutans]|uniref:Helix-hairpin-helix DNA-binding motif class 1 domain-containing protein n=1 Tax=Companilactobacillus ginsenosidimutans TaxID=1007676 RepID=A0A0H4QEU4_9LACO|nr:helix-hairpin-helix domain-containing protein [Companilactobacillus ginsenosidimutans]AKP66447.1 hypothetical protein ABM34_02025 [Companilactobacillus ginsenosidimutans]